MGRGHCEATNSETLRQFERSSIIQVWGRKEKRLRFSNGQVDPVNDAGHIDRVDWNSKNAVHLAREVISVDLVTGSVGEEAPATAYLDCRGFVRLAPIRPPVGQQSADIWPPPAGSESPDVRRLSILGHGREHALYDIGAILSPAPRAGAMLDRLQRRQLQRHGQSVDVLVDFNSIEFLPQRRVELRKPES